LPPWSATAGFRYFTHIRPLSLFLSPSLSLFLYKSLALHRPDNFILTLYPASSINLITSTTTTSHPTITTNLYQTVLGLAARALQTAEPVISRTQPLISSADNLAVATFDRVEAAFPYLKTPTQELAGFKQAKAFHDERVVPALEEVIKKTSAINTELGSLQTKAAEVIHKGEKASHELVEQLKALREQSKDLPAQLIEGLGKVTNDVKAIVLAKDGTVQEKTNKLGSYVVEQVKPIIDEIYKHVLGAKKAAVEKVQEAAPAQQQTTPAPSQEKEKVIDTPSE
jgi:hypothetical protein